ncbi:nucleoside recognition protein [Alkaliphilus sp. MSJ-5]|uniref:Nucleoside recognition protein n=1 Tax=Alkaliphilus flagellatus TaxID=2841507 RepID=A0ABS6G5V5_9FIRM|nr:nucleoside recognition domain-containing protein [Alkaliphilus flagellatus]MBU5676800.1 nucleoside recognition protein [Alkaliphilus flagellatus]
MIDILKESVMGSFNSIYSIAKIVIPLMIILQVAKDYKLLDKISKFLEFLTKFFGMSKESTLPLLVGIIFGLSYGAGVIIQSAKDGNLSTKDTFLISVFLVTCHAIVEDTLIFVAVDANGYILLSLRVFAAVVMTFVLSKRLKISESTLKQDINQ